MGAIDDRYIHWRTSSKSTLTAAIPARSAGHWVWESEPELVDEAEMLRYATACQNLPARRNFCSKTQKPKGLKGHPSSKQESVNALERH